MRVRPSESDGVKFDWAKDFQCGKLLNMILQEDDIHLGNFDDPCDLKHLRFDSLDDDDHTLWVLMQEEPEMAHVFCLFIMYFEFRIFAYAASRLYSQIPLQKGVDETIYYRCYKVSRTFFKKI